MFGKKDAPTSGDVVARLRDQVQAAKALASVPDQDLLTDARLNPRTRPEADRLTAERLAVELELEHRRRLRAAREQDRVEEETARAARAVARARSAVDPARSVLSLDRSRTRFTVGALAASVVCSVGSAMGVEALAASWGAPTGVGYAAELAMTGMSTAAIAWRGGLARAGAFIEQVPDRIIWGLIAVPLVASIVASTAGSGPIGAVCSVGAALFAWLAYLVSVTGADAINQSVDRMDKQTKQTPSPSVTVTEAPSERAARPEAGDGLEVVGESLAEEAQEYLAALPPRESGGGDDGGAVAVIPPRDDGGDDGSTGDVHPPSGGGDDGPVSLVEAARRRSESAAERVREYYARYPQAPVKAAARALAMDPKTVRRYRPTSGGGAS